MVSTGINRCRVGTNKCRVGSSINGRRVGSNLGTAGVEEQHALGDLRAGVREQEHLSALLRGGQGVSEGNRWLVMGGIDGF